MFRFLFRYYFVVYFLINFIIFFVVDLFKVFFVNFIILDWFKCLINEWDLRMFEVFIENLFKFRFKRSGIVVWFLVIFLYILVYLFFLWEVLIIILIKCKMDGLYGW